MSIPFCNVKADLDALGSYTFECFVTKAIDVCECRLPIHAAYEMLYVLQSFFNNPINIASKGSK